MIGYYIENSASFPVYTYGEIVLRSSSTPVVLSGYIRWTPSSISGSFTMEGSVYSFEDYNGYFEFSGSSITSSAFRSNPDIVTVETNATEIQDNAFRDCTALVSASLSTCSVIGSTAFFSCYSLSSVYVPNVTSVSWRGFEYCSSLTSIDLPNCSHIDAAAFGYCLSLSRISTPKVEYISRQAFYSCPLLASVYLPSCSVIESGAFQRCYALSSVSIPVCESIGSSAFRSCSSLASMELPVCSFIGEQAFSGCVSLSAITVGSSSVCVLSNSNAFQGTGITSTTGDILVPESLYESYVIAPEWSYFFRRIRPIEGFYVRWTPSNITGTFKIESQTYNFADYSGEFRWSTGSIGFWAFRRASFTSMETNARYIDIEAFASCSNLSYANCTAVKNPGDGFFAYCSNLSYVNLPLCRALPAAAFAGCTALISVSVPRVNNIDGYAFNSCYNLISIVLPRCATIWDYAFYHCGLRTITLGSTRACKMEGSRATFEGTSVISIYVPASLVSVYPGTDYWYSIGASSEWFQPINN